MIRAMIKSWNYLLFICISQDIILKFYNWNWVKWHDKFICRWMIRHKDHGRWCHQRDNSSITDWSFACQSVNWRWNINITRIDYTDYTCVKYSQPRGANSSPGNNIPSSLLIWTRKRECIASMQPINTGTALLSQAHSRSPSRFPLKSNLIWPKLRAKYKEPGLLKWDVKNIW